MRFNWLRISSIIVCVLVFSACGNDEENEDIDLEKEAEEISVEFLDTLYNVEESHFVDENDTVEEVADYFEQQVDEYEVYFTEEELEELTNTRFFSKPDEAASKQEATITMKNLEVDAEETNEEGEWEFEHTFTLIFEDESGEEIKSADMSGQITVVEDTGDMKIDRYYDNGFPEDMLESL
ncbi:MAG TPA: hypothetical protein VK108_11515 [Pseudogracilibacillus sp.]|nr:hypothetical protein [Pseudogracilibacillus sp.]